ncbi:MAG: hypothetical protein Q8R18_01780 [bacterium]|nr:hypothetical protein [bacterium]
MSIFVFLYELSLIEDVIIYETDAIISGENDGGFNLDADKLHFGLVPINSPYSYRKIDFVNSYNETVHIDVQSYGNIQAFISYEYKGERKENNLIFDLEPSETISLKVIFSPTAKNVEVDDYYQGYILILVKEWSFLDALSFWVEEQLDYYL